MLFRDRFIPRFLGRFNFKLKTNGPFAHLVRGYLQTVAAFQGDHPSSPAFAGGAWRRRPLPPARGRLAYPTGFGEREQPGRLSGRSRRSQFPQRVRAAPLIRWDEDQLPLVAESTRKEGQRHCIPG